VSHATKLLFLCSRNKIRSLTAEKLLEGVPGYEARSAGTQPSARITVTSGLIRWADIVFCMEKSHLQKIRARFPEELQEKQVVTLHIPDEFAFMGEDLLDELRAKLAEHLSLPDAGSAAGECGRSAECTKGPETEVEGAAAGKSVEQAAGADDGQGPARVNQGESGLIKVN
jgi:predicted protein tyrosine phosphatase